MIDFSGYKKAFSAPPSGVTEAELNADTRRDLAVWVRDGRQSGCESFDKTTLYLRATAGQSTGTVYTERLDEEPSALIRQAAENAGFSGGNTPEAMNRADMPALNEAPDDDGKAAADILNIAREIERAAREISPEPDRAVRVTECGVRKTVFERRVINSHGLDNYHGSVRYVATLKLTADRASGAKQDGTAIFCTNALNRLKPAEIAAAALDDANRKDLSGALKPCKMPSGTYRAVLSNTVVRNIIATAWQTLTLKYMKNGASVYSGAAGEKIGSPLLNIIDTPTHPSWAYNSALDSEGAICREKYVVRGGILESPLGTGNSGRVALLTGNTPINLVTIPSIIYIAPGETPASELAAKMRDGILLTYSLDVFHSINIASGAFSIPCGGIRYRGGEPVGTVDQLTMAGNIKDLFGNIGAVGDDLSFEEFWYKNYSYGGPSLMAEGLVFSSKG